MIETSVSHAETVTRALERGLDVVFLLLREQHGLGVTEIAHRLGLSKATAWRLLATLEQKGFVGRDASGKRYSLTFGLLALVQSRLRSVDISAAVDGPMRRLSQTTGETVGLYVRVGYFRVCVHQVEGKHELRRVAQVGQLRPLSTGSAGRMLLAAAPASDVSAVLEAQPLTARTANSVVNEAEFRALLANARANGYAIARDETVEGVAGISVPVIAASSEEILAALNVSGPSERWTEEAMLAALPGIQAAAKELSGCLDLGGDGRAVGALLADGYLELASEEPR